MCKIRTLNGESLRPTFGAREDEVFGMIRDNENYKVGDIIPPYLLKNKTKKMSWEIIECNRVEGGHVAIKDSNGKICTAMFVFGKGQKKTTTAKTEETQATAQE